MKTETGRRKIVDACRRLRAMAQDPPFVFRDTPKELAQQYLHRLTRFEGYSEPAIAATERALGLPFPETFRSFLGRLGERRGDLFVGSEVAGLADFEEFAAEATQLLATAAPSLDLPSTAIVFLWHQGYSFSFIEGESGIDGPVWTYVEGESRFRAAAPSFADFLESELRLLEKNHAVQHERGGYYLTVDPRGVVTASYPAGSSGDRPLERS